MPSEPTPAWLNPNETLLWSAYAEPISPPKRNLLNQLLKPLIATKHTTRYAVTTQRAVQINARSDTPREVIKSVILEGATIARPTQSTSGHTIVFQEPIPPNALYPTPALYFHRLTAQDADALVRVLQEKLSLTVNVVEQYTPMDVDLSAWDEAFSKLGADWRKLESMGYMRHQLLGVVKGQITLEKLLKTMPDGR